MPTSCRCLTTGSSTRTTGRGGEGPPTELSRKERPKNQSLEPRLDTFIACGRSSKERPPRSKPATQVSPCCLQNNVSSASCCSGHNCPGDGHPVHQKERIVPRCQCGEKHPRSSGCGGGTRPKKQSKVNCSASTLQLTPLTYRRVMPPLSIGCSKSESTLLPQKPAI